MDFQGDWLSLALALPFEKLAPIIRSTKFLYSSGIFDVVMRWK